LTLRVFGIFCSNWDRDVSNIPSWFLRTHNALITKCKWESLGG
jgi:hypothetical protein